MPISTNLTAFKDVVKIYRDAGISIISLGVETFVGDPKERDCFRVRRARRGETYFGPFQRSIPFPRRDPSQTQKLSDEFGIRVGIHCHGGYQFGGQPDVLDYLVKLGSPQVGVCIDTAWCMQIGPQQGNPVEWAKRYAGRIYGIHYKDFKFEPTGQWVDTIVGEGNLDLPAFIKALDENGFDGMAVIEYEADVENPCPR